MKKQIHLLVLSAVAIGSPGLVSSVAAAAVARRPAMILNEFTLPPFSLVDFGYTEEELAAAQANGLTSTDYPAIGSGLQQAAGNHFISITDRGPNADRADGFKAFPLPQFTPTIVFFRAESDRIVPEAVLPLVNNLGQGITGIPNGPADDGIPYLTLTATVPLPFNPDGMDVEDVRALPGGGFIIVEEYGPSVVIVGPAGNVLKRYTPTGKTLPGAHYTVCDTLPPVLKQRRANRGFESIPVSADVRTAYTVTQSPMGSTSATSPYRSSRLVRIFRFDISDPLNLQVTGQFVLLMSPASDYPASDYPAGNAQRDLKISGAAWVSQDKLLLMERTDKAGSGGARLILVDLTGATDVKDFAAAAAVPLVLENINVNLAALGITPASSRVVLDVNNELPTITDYKLEGLSILNANTVAFSNDNDFGIGENPNANSKVYTILLGKPLPLGQ